MTKIHIIHDASNVERADFLRETIEMHQIDAVIWPPVWRNIAEAHKRIVRYAKEHKLKEIIIAEDDLFFYAPDGLEYYLKNKPKSFDLYLGGVYRNRPELSEENKVVRLFSGLHLYTVSERFYDLFLSADTSKNSIDNALSVMASKGYGKYVVCYPFAAVQREVASTNPDSNQLIYQHKYFFNSKNTYGYVYHN